MTRQSKLTQENNKVTVEYPQDVDQVTVKISTGDGQNQQEPVTKKIDFKQGQQGSGQGNNNQKPDGQQGQKPDQGQQDQQPNQGQQPQDEQQIQVQAQQDEKDPHLITLKATKFPQGVDKLIIDWGVQQVGNTPKELTKEKPEVSVKFSPKTQRVTVTVDDEDNPETQPWVKAFKLGGQQGQQPSGGESGGSGDQGSGQDSSGGQSGSQPSQGTGGQSGGSGQGGQNGSPGKGGQSGGQSGSGSSGGSQ